MSTQQQASALVERLLCDNLKTLKPYESARRLFSGGRDWLNANESPYANPYTCDASRFNRYPDCQPTAVVQSYADYAGIEKEQLIVTRGADEGIELLIRAFCTPGQDRVLICPPTYGMYAISAETCNVAVDKIPLNPDFSLNLGAIKAHNAAPKVVFVCAPNNPTGTGVAADNIKALLAHFAKSALVVVDEAYIEMTGTQGWAPLLNAYPNLVILRTLSKAFALAGLRCGFTLANAPVIQALMKVIAPYPVPEPVAQIAAQALSAEGIAKMRSQVSELNAEKTRIAEALCQIPEVALVGDTQANFVLFRCPQKQALMDFLVADGLLIRDQSKQLMLENCLRVTVGTSVQNDRFLHLMSDFFHQEKRAV